MADQPLSGLHHHVSPNQPPSVEGAFASLGFDPPAEHSASIYQLQSSYESSRSGPSRMQSASRNHSANNNAALNLDPVPGDPDTVFLRPPFTDYPGAAEQKHKTGLTYNILATNPNWFLDVNDFIGPNAAVYPPQLEPPRGWCPTKKKDANQGWKEGEEPRLRCTLCRRQYAGVNAKSMWRRHVYEKHKIAMANRRETNERPGGRGGRASNKENKAAPDPLEKEPDARSTSKAVRRVMSLEVQASASSASHAGPSVPFKQTSVDNTVENGAYPQSSGDEEHLLTEGPSFSSTPPQTPGVSPNKVVAEPLDAPFDLVVPPESPYNPLMTPAFRHSPVRLPSKQPWRFSPRNGKQMRDYTLAMLARGEASPNVRGLDVSPIVLVPASERQKRSIFSPPRSKSLLSISPRRLFSDAAENDSIQSRFDQPGWEVPTTPGTGLIGGLLATPGQDMPSGIHDLDLEDIIRGLTDADAVESGEGRPPSPDLISSHTELDKKSSLDYLKWPVELEVMHGTPSHTLSSVQYTPHTKMFINGIVSPGKGPDSSPTPSFSASPSTGSRSRRASTSSSAKAASLSATPLLPPFSALRADTPLDNARDPGDLFGSASSSKMDVDDLLVRPPGLSTPAKVDGPIGSWQDLFNPSASVHSTSDGDDRSFLSTSASSSIFTSSAVLTSRSNLSVSGSGGSHTRRTSSPSRSRARSVSNAGANGSMVVSGSSSGHKHSLGTTTATVGLMDAILDKKPRRRKHSHSEHRIVEGEVGVTAMGSPFKVGKKTSRREFLYSLDGDCEMQDAQPRKRRKTISGQD